MVVDLTNGIKCNILISQYCLFVFCMSWSEWQSRLRRRGAGASLMTNVGPRPALLSRWVTSVQLPGLSYAVARQQGCPGFCSTEPHIC
jgi:hypothetical protein